MKEPGGIFNTSIVNFFCYELGNPSLLCTCEICSEMQMELKERSVLRPPWETELKLAGAGGLRLLAPNEGDVFPRVCGESS